MKTTATHILTHGGIIRRIDNHGYHILPYRIKKDKQFYTDAHSWTMYFDTHPGVLDEMHRVLKVDPRVLRYTVVKKGERLEEVCVDVVDEARLGSMARGGVGSLGSMFYHKLQF